MPDLEREGEPQAAEPARGRVPSRGKAATDRPVVVMKPGNAGGAKGSGHLGLVGGQLPEQEEPKSKPKPKQFAVSKQVVWEAYRRVKANKGSAGVDGQAHTPQVVGRQNAAPSRRPSVGMVKAAEH